VIDLFQPRAALEAEILGKRAIGFWATTEDSSSPIRTTFLVHPALS
jgi:hypothetical protein